MAFLSWRIAQDHADDVGRLLGSQSTLFCLIAGLVKAPLFIQGTALLGILVYPTCSFRAEPGKRIIRPTCSRLCLLRSQCQPLHR